jgi:hypothetical protein
MMHEVFKNALPCGFRRWKMSSSRRTKIAAGDTIDASPAAAEEH